MSTLFAKMMRRLIAVQIGDKEYFRMKRNRKKSASAKLKDALFKIESLEKQNWSLVLELRELNYRADARIHDLERENESLKKFVFSGITFSARAEHIQKEYEELMLRTCNPVIYPSIEFVEAIRRRLQDEC